MKGQRQKTPRNISPEARTLLRYLIAKRLLPHKTNILFRTACRWSEASEASFTTGKQFEKTEKNEFLHAKRCAIEVSCVETRTATVPSGTASRRLRARQSHTLPEVSVATGACAYKHHGFARNAGHGLVAGPRRDISAFSTATLFFPEAADAGDRPRAARRDRAGRRVRAAIHVRGMVGVNRAEGHRNGHTEDCTVPVPRLGMRLHADCRRRRMATFSATCAFTRLATRLERTRAGHGERRRTPATTAIPETPFVRASASLHASLRPSVPLRLTSLDTMASAAQMSAAAPKALPRQLRTGASFKARARAPRAASPCVRPPPPARPTRLCSWRRCSSWPRSARRLRRRRPSPALPPRRATTARVSRSRPSTPSPPSVWTSTPRASTWFPATSRRSPTPPWASCSARTRCSWTTSPPPFAASCAAARAPTTSPSRR